MSYLGGGADWRIRNYLLGLEGCDFGSLNVLLNGSAFVDSSPAAHVITQGGTTAANVGVPPAYRATKSDPFNPNDLGIIDISDTPKILFGAGNFKISARLRADVGRNVICFQRGQVNGGFSSELVWYVMPGTGFPGFPVWNLCATQGIGVQMLTDFGLATNPPLFYSFVFDTAPLPNAAVEQLFSVQRCGNEVFMEVDGVVHRPSAVLGSTEFAAGYTLDASAASTPIYLFNRGNEAYVYDAFLRDYRVYTQVAGGVKYSRWNPEDKGAGIALTLGARVATSTGPAVGIRGFQGRAGSDNRYFELTCTDPNVLCGIALLTANIVAAPGYPGNDLQSYGYYGLTGQLFNNNAGAAYGAAYVAGDVIGFWLNAGDLVIYKNGVSQGVAVAGLSGTWYPCWGPGSGDGVPRSSSINTGAEPFFSLPPGAIAWG